MTKTDWKHLENFCHAMMWSSQLGYVLYGDKPICLEGYSKTAPNTVFHVGNHLQSAISAGISVWNRLQLPLESSKFALIDQSIDQESSLILFINKEALKEVFNENSTLFRYTLGHELTTDKLLNAFKYDDFFSLLKNDNVLIGLLLGFGFENSLHVGRLERISEDIHSAAVIKNISLQPSFGYSSLSQEWEIINKKIECASESLENYDPKLIFGKVSNRLESNNNLIKNYELTQLEILDVLDNPDWLQQILSLLIDEPVTIKIIETSSSDKCEFSDRISSKAATQIIYCSFDDEFESQDINMLEEFIAGMKEAEKRADAHYIAPFPGILKEQYPFQSTAFLVGFKTWSFYKFNEGFFDLNSVVEGLRNISKGNENSNLSNLAKNIPDVQSYFFETIDKHERSLALFYFQKFENAPSNFKCLVKDRLYYQQLTPGYGVHILKDLPIQISYILKTAYGNIIEERLDATLDLRRAIRAFRAGLPFMRVGEKGVLFIHPEWGVNDYFAPPYFSPYLTAEFEIRSA